ncbi:energy transducer TonB [Parahaliea mediterranea]|uniref:Energy transducer TonB n=1 Tax=Parahaliea mediterranea TaxID=651086 RepID=A0A939DBA4_9GAMM|nr:energy transducer TonB [Parahaliea mediterranea]MBN7794991.1 energy transducer TonB [Parahaliea mediterranea]
MSISRPHHPPFALGRALCRWLCVAALLFPGGLWAQSAFVPPQNLHPENKPALDAGFDMEAWLVYTYEIDTDGRVVNATIHSSNQVEAVNRRMLEQIEAMRFRPATRNGQPVKVPVGPVIYTWILDIPREMRPRFGDVYDRAWEHFRAGDYDQAFKLAAQLKEMPGRNGFEEVKFQILAASIASRWDDPAAEMQHLQRIVEFENLAGRNGFRHPYVDPDQFALILERIHSLQLANNQLADAQATFNRIMMRGTSEEVTQRVQAAQQAGQADFLATARADSQGELTPLYRGGTGSWEARLTRDRFRLEGVRGDIDWLYLACLGNEKRLPYPTTEPWSVPGGWKECKVEISGRAGTRFQLRQLAPGVD